MNSTTLTHSKKVYRLGPTLETLRNIGECIILIPLIPVIAVISAINSIREAPHSPKTALGELLSAVGLGCIIVFGGLGCGIYEFFRILIFGEPD